MLLKYFLSIFIFVISVQSGAETPEEAFPEAPLNEVQTTSQVPSTTGTGSKRKAAPAQHLRKSDSDETSANTSARTDKQSYDKKNIEPTQITPETQLDQALKPLFSSKGFEAQIERQIHLESLDTDQPKETGTLTVAGSKLRLEIRKPNRSLLVLNNATVWLETHPDASLGGSVQVHRGKLQGSKDSQIFTALLGGTTWRNQFQLIKLDIMDGTYVYILEPKRVIPELKRVVLTMNDENKKLLSLSYTDELKNKTSYIFEQLVPLKSVAKNKFDYQPPKGAVVTELN